TMQVISTIVILLGSHIDTLLKDRCDVVTKYFYESEPNSRPHVYISGGIKHSVELQSEAYLALRHMSNSSSLLLMTDYIITDVEATNTAENFRNLKCKLYDLLPSGEKPKIVIATSKFHHKRAKKFFDAYFPDYGDQETWLLGDKSCYYCENDEKFHIKNVEADVAKAPSTCM
ncbi:YdcF family protein, partial [Porticoccaceae bacterium]|nr:YdcF family protein [Porticoccaceae bacterium]